MSPYAFLAAGLIVATASIAYGVVDATQPVQVYGSVNGYDVERRRDADGIDRVYVTASVHKLLDCDLESGDGPPWVDFYDRDDASNPPPSALYKPDGFPAGNTMGNAGEKIAMNGYSAIVPNKMRAGDGYLVISVPCQLWTQGKDGKREWGRKVVGQWGPVPVPMPGKTVRQKAL